MITNKARKNFPRNILSKQEEDSTKSDILEGSNQTPQVRKIQKDEFEQGSQGTRRGQL